MSNVRAIASGLDVLFPVAGANNSTSGFRSNTSLTLQALNQTHDELTTLQNTRFAFSGDAAGTAANLGSATTSGGLTTLNVSLNLSSILGTSGNTAAAALDTTTQDFEVRFDAKGRAFLAAAKTSTTVSGTYVAGENTSVTALTPNLGTGTGQIYLPSLTFNSLGRLTGFSRRSINYGLLNHTLATNSMIIGRDSKSAELTSPLTGNFTLTSSNGTVAWTPGSTVYTDEQARDAVGAALRAPSGYNWVIDDNNDLMSLAIGDVGLVRQGLGLGTAATKNTGTSGDALPVLNANNTWAGTNLFISLINGNINGNAGTATSLQNARTINGVSFNGTQDIVINSSDAIPRLAVSQNLADLSSVSTARNNLGLGTASLLGEATALEFRGNTAGRALSTTTVWTSAAPVTLTDAATIIIDMSTFINATVVLKGNRTLGAPSNAKPGQSGYIAIYQDATGSRTLSYNSAWKFPGAVIPTLSTAANALDILHFEVLTASVIIVTSILKAVA